MSNVSEELGNTWRAWTFSGLGWIGALEIQLLSHTIVLSDGAKPKVKVLCPQWGYDKVIEAERGKESESRIQQSHINTNKDNRTKYPYLIMILIYFLVLQRIEKAFTLLVLVTHFIILSM